MKLRRKCFSPTWRMKKSHVKICDFSRGESVASVCNESINARGDDQLVWPSPLTLMGMSCLEVRVDSIDECLADPLDEVSLAQLGRHNVERYALLLTVIRGL